MALAPAARRAWLATALALLAIAVFWPARENDWLNYDDDIYITQNPPLTRGLSAEGLSWAFSTFHGANWFPLTWLSWMLDWELYGLDPKGFHTTSLLLHGVSTALLFLALARMTRATGRSAFVAAVFALHPLHVESVAWGAARKDTLSGLFFMLALLAYGSRSAQRRGHARVWVFVWLALGLLAKQTLVTLPLLLLLLDDWPLDRLRRADAPRRWDRRALRAALVEKLPLFLLVTASGIVTVIAQRSAGAVAELDSLPLVARLENAIVSGAAYLGQSVWPSGLTVFYPHPGTALPVGQVLAAAGLLALLSLGVWRAARYERAVAVGWLWFWIALLPVIGVVQVGSQSRADRYTYLPLIGLAISLAWGLPAALARLWPRRETARRRALGAAACLAIAALGLLTSVQLRYWRNSESLFRHALEVTDDNHVAHAYLGRALLARGQVEQAIAHWKEAARLEPGFLQVHNNLAWLLATAAEARHRDPAEAVRLAERAARLAPEDPAVLDTLAAAYARAGRFDAAITAAGRALASPDAQRDPAFEADIRARLALYRQGRAYTER